MHIIKIVLLTSAFAVATITYSAPPRVTKNGSNTIIEFSDPINIDVPTERRQGSPRVGNGADGLPVSNPKSTSTTLQPTAGKAPTPSASQRKEAQDAARELLLRYGDKPLINDSFIVEKAWDRLVEMLPAGLGQLLKLLTPSELGTDSWLDFAETKREMLGARYLIEEELQEKIRARTEIKENEKKLGLPPTIEPPNAPVQPVPEQNRFNNAMRELASAKGPEVGQLVAVLLERGSRSHEFSIEEDTIETIAEKIRKLAPPNACVVSRTKWSCPIFGGKVGDVCFCPELGRGYAGLRQMSEFCIGAISKCRFDSSYPVGTPCNCAQDYQIQGFIPYGRIVARPRR